MGPVVIAIILGVGITAAIGLFVYNNLFEREQTHGNQNNSYNNSFSHSYGESAPNARFESDSYRCTICFEDITNGEAITNLRCCHRFHLVCINGWMAAEDRALCPNCRMPIR